MSTRIRRPWLPVGSWLVCSLFATGCSDSEPTGPATVGSIPSSQERLTVEPASVGLLLGESVQLLVSGSPPRGFIGPLSITWSSSDTGVADVSFEGVVTAVGKGSAFVTASRAGQTATAFVKVGTGERE